MECLVPLASPSAPTNVDHLVDYGCCPPRGQCEDESREAVQHRNLQRSLGCGEAVFEQEIMQSECGDDDPADRGKQRRPEPFEDWSRRRSDPMSLPSVITKGKPLDVSEILD